LVGHGTNRPCSRNFGCARIKTRPAATSFFMEIDLCNFQRFARSAEN
jgi:hypothetical protein